MFKNTLDFNLREEMLELINQTKYRVLLQCTSKKIHCDCYNEKYNEPNSKCPKCLGTGWLFKFIETNTFKQDVSRIEKANKTIEFIGEINSNDKVFYFPFDANPKRKDYIWEVSWINNKPNKLLNLYRIESVSEQRNEFGSIDFIVVLAKREPLNKDFKNAYIGKAWKEL